MNSTINKPDIIYVLSSEGIQLKQKGQNFWGLCPFPGHTEKTPSFKVDPERQNFHCFGCGTGGDVIAFVQKFKGISFRDTLKYLGIEGGEYKPDPIVLHKKELIADFEAWCRGYFGYLCDCLIRLEKIKKTLCSEKQVEAFAEYYHLESLWLYRLSILESTDNNARLELYREVINEN